MFQERLEHYNNIGLQHYYFMSLCSDQVKIRKIQVKITS
jgi:hypothetical protein